MIHCLRTMTVVAIQLAGIVVDFGKKKHLKKAPKEKKHIFSKKKKKKHPFHKKHFWSRKKHLVNIILLTKSNKKVLAIKLFS